MTKRFMTMSYTVLTMIMLAFGATFFVSVPVQADVIPFFQDGEDTDSDLFSAFDDEDDEASDSNVMKGLMAAGLAGIAGLTGLCLMKSRRNKALLEEEEEESFETYNQLYDRFHRYYAYCVEQIRLAENKGISNHKREIESIKQDIKEMYCRMCEEKIQYTHMRHDDYPYAAERINALGRKARSNIAKMEAYLTTLRKYNINSNL